MIASGGWYQWNWNVVIGCKHGCKYCYARRWVTERKWIGSYEEPEFFADRLTEPLKVKKPAVIFVCAYADLFGEWVPDEWITQVIDIVAQASWHTFVFITKNPDRYKHFILPDNVYLGVTIESPEMMFRTEKLKGLPNKKFASIEPCQGDFTGIDLSLFDWVVVGYQIYKKKTPQDRRNVQSVKHHNLHVIQR